MKKLLTVLALLLIVLSLFAAGAKEEAKSSEKIELTFGPHLQEEMVNSLMQ